MGQKLRNALYTVISWLHCVLIFAPIYACIAVFLYKNHGSGYYLVQGLLFAIPIALLQLAARKLRYLWQYLLAVVGICTALFVVTGCYVLLIMLAIMALVYLSARVQKGETVFDSPALPGLVFFAVSFVFSGVVVQPLVQLCSLIFSAIYLALWFAFKGIKRTADFVRVNEGMANLPAKRILKSSGLIYLGSTVLILLISVPLLIGTFRFVKIEQKSFEINSKDISQEDTSRLIEGGGTPDMSWLGDEEPAEPPIIFTILGNVLFVLLIGVAAALLCFGIYRLTVNFRVTVREKNDLIESIGSDMVEDAAAVPRSQKLRRLDFSPNASARRRYVKAIRAAKKALPEKWQSPLEIEENAGIRDARLHGLYEKARYSEAGCTKEDLR